MTRDTRQYGGRAADPVPGTLGLAVPVTNQDHVLGNPDAPVTLVQYGDYDCRRCVHAAPAVNALLDYYGTRVRFVFRHFPRNCHGQCTSLTAQAAEAAEAAGAQGKFWEMHELLLSHGRSLDPMHITFLALTIGLEIYRFNAELARGIHALRVRGDYLGGLRSGVDQTPTFFLNGELVGFDRRIQGALDAVHRAIESHA